MFQVEFNEFKVSASAATCGDQRHVIAQQDADIVPSYADVSNLFIQTLLSICVVKIL